MKIGVIGDIHVGAHLTGGVKDHVSGLNTRLVDYYNTLIATIDAMADAGVKVMCATGDYFEHRNPDAKQQELLSKALRHALDRGIEEIHLVIGNHDQNRRQNSTTVGYLKELNLPNIRVYDEIDVHTVKENGVPVANLIFMPYRDRKWFGTDSQEIAVKQYDELLSYCVGSIDNSAPKIVVGHMTIEGTLWMLDQYAELYNGNDLVLPVSMFNNIDITVMGHVHTPGIISKKPFVYYVGSMEKRSASENHNKKYMIIDTETSKLSMLNEPCREIHDIRMDFSSETQAELLMGKVRETIDIYSESHILKDAIVRVLINLVAEDDSFFDADEAEAYLRTRHQVFHCNDIKPSLLFSRQARDSDITEHSSDAESFGKFVRNTIKDNELLEAVLSHGLEIISANNQEG